MIEAYINDKGLRVYTDANGLDYISCTSLLGLYEDQSGLRIWEEKLGIEEANRQRDEAAERGTYAHELVEWYLNAPLDKRHELELECPSVYAKNAIKGFYSNVVPLEMEEVLLFNDGKVRFAGRFDQIVEFPDGTFCFEDGTYVPGGRVMVDLKTKAQSKGIKHTFIFKHLLQASAYIVAKEAQSGIKLDGAVIVFSYPRSCKKVYLSRYSVDKYWDVYYKLLSDYYSIKPLTESWNYLSSRMEYAWCDKTLSFESYTADTII